MVCRRRILLVLAALSSSGIALCGPPPDRSEVQELIDASRWRDAVPVLTRLLESNPYHGEDWYRLGLAHARLGDCETATPFLVRAIELGADGSAWGMRYPYVEAAHCAALLGDLDAAVDRLAIAQARYKFGDFRRFDEDPRFTSLVEHAGYRKLAGDLDGSKVGRIEGWSADLDYFIDLLERRHPRPFHTADERAWRAEAQALRQQLANSSDLDVIVGFMRLAAMIGDGHTTVYPPVAGPSAFRMTPVWPYAFGDDWRIVAAAPGFEYLAGARIVAVEGVPMAEASERMAAYLPADNAMTHRWMVAVALQFADVSRGIFGAEESCCLTLDVELDSGERRTVRLPGGPPDRNPMSAWAPAYWVSVQHRESPLWLENVGATFWYAEDEDRSLIYAQINGIRDDEAVSFEAFGRELRQRIADGGFRHLVLDLRHNNGGNGYLNWPFVRELVRAEALDRADALFVITGRRTFSAAMLLSSMLEFHTNAIFVGEPTGSRPQFYGEDTDFRLPFSGLTGSISSRWFQNRFISDDERPWIAPDIRAELTIQDLREGRDPALHAIRRYLESSRAPR